MANITVPIQVNLPDDWKEQIVNRLRNDPEFEWVEIIRCKDCKYAEESDEREWLLCHWYGDQWNEEDHWCSHAERNVDE